MHRCLHAIALGGLILAGPAAIAQDMPPPDTLQAIVSQLGKRLPQNTTTFARSATAADAGLCRMQPFRMTLGRGLRSTQTHSVLLDPQHSAAPVEPSEFLITVNRMTVDADGSPRSYHPEDPYGTGRCDAVRRPDGTTALSGVCAVDAFPSGSILLFRGGKKLARPDLAPFWAQIWPLIRDRKLKSVSLSSVVGPKVAESYYFFHSRADNLTAFLKDTIVPKTRDGYPCLHDPASPHAGYFLSATTLVDHSAPVRGDGCRPGHYMDSEIVPFIVLPRGGFGKVGIGDAAIVRMEGNTIFAIVGDAGPAHRIGEGSIALNQMLLGKNGPAMNTRDVYAIDISGKAVSMLVLGGTSASFNGDYSPRNIRAVSERLFREWSGGDSMARLDACIRLLGGKRD